MKLAVVGDYTKEQLDNCIKTIYGQKDAEFEVFFSCCNTKEELAFLIHNLSLHENRKITNIHIERDVDANFGKRIKNILKQYKTGNLLFLINGTTLYDPQAIAKCSEVIVSNKMCLSQSVLYDENGKFIEVSPLSNDEILEWNMKNTSCLTGAIINAGDYTSWMRRIQLVKMLQLQSKPKDIKPINIPIVKVEKQNQQLKNSPIEEMDQIVDWYDVYSVEDYCKQNKIDIHIVVEEGEGKVYEPEFYKFNQEKVYTFDRPKVYWAELENVEVLSESGIIIKDGSAYCDEFAFDVETRNHPISKSMVERNQNNIGLMYRRNEEVVDEAICLLNWASINYYHLTLETIAKLAFINDNEGFDDYIILADEAVTRYQQFQDLLGMMKKNRKIKYVKAGESIRVKKMVYVSPVSWMPIRLLDRTGLKDSDSVIVEGVIRELRKAASDSIKEKTDRKIFISRKNTINIRMDNEDEIISLFKEKGFEIVQTETMTLKEQIECFSSAGCIVGASGAAFTNIIYCNPKTVIGCIKARDVRFFKYSTIAYYLDLKTLFGDCRVIEYSNQGSSDVREMDVDYCREYIDELIERMKD